MADLENLKIEIDASDKGASASLDRLEQTLEKISSALDKLSIGDGVSKGLAEISRNIAAIAEATRGLDSSALKEMAKDIDRVSSAEKKLSKSKKDSTDFVFASPEASKFQAIADKIKEVNSLISGMEKGSIPFDEGEYRNALGLIKQLKAERTALKKSFEQPVEDTVSKSMEKMLPAIRKSEEELQKASIPSRT